MARHYWFARCGTQPSGQALCQPLFPSCSADGAGGGRAEVNQLTNLLVCAAQLQHLHLHTAAAQLKIQAHSRMRRERGLVFLPTPTNREHLHNMEHSACCTTSTHCRTLMSESRAGERRKLTLPPNSTHNHTHYSSTCFTVHSFADTRKHTTLGAHGSGVFGARAKTQANPTESSCLHTLHHTSQAVSMRDKGKLKTLRKCWQ